MNTQPTFTDGRVDRKWFPDVDAVAMVMGTHAEAQQRRLGELYQLAQAALNELKGLHVEVKDGVGTLIGEVRDDMADLFDEELATRGLRGSATHLSRSVGDLIKGAVGQLITVKDGGDDLAFLLRRMVQYRNALLGYVTLLDPVGIQDEMVGRAVLIYRAPGGAAFSCRVNADAPLTDVIKDRAGVSVRDADIADQENLDALVRSVYIGAEGIADRMNVLFVDAPKDSGLKPRMILSKGASIYREACRDARKTGAAQDAKADSDE